MTTWLTNVACALALVLSACGDKGADGKGSDGKAKAGEPAKPTGGYGGASASPTPSPAPVVQPTPAPAAQGAAGVYDLDQEAVYELNKADFEKEQAANFAELKQQMQELKAMPAAERALATEKILEMVPQDMRAHVMGLLSDNAAEHDAALKAMFMSGWSAMKASFELKADGSATSDFRMGDDVEQGTGTWSQAGDVVTVTPKTKNGKPVSGEDAKTLTFAFKDGRLTGGPGEGGPKLAFKRK